MAAFMRARATRTRINADRNAVQSYGRHVLNIIVTTRVNNPSPHLTGRLHAGQLIALERNDLTGDRLEARAHHYQ